METATLLLIANTLFFMRNSYRLFKTYEDEERFRPFYIFLTLISLSAVVIGLIPVTP